MSKVCIFCGKGNLNRNNGRHTSHNRKKTFANRGPQGLRGVKSSASIKPNFREVRLAKGTPKVISCMRCYKSLKVSLEDALNAANSAKILVPAGNSKAAVAAK